MNDKKRRSISYLFVIVIMIMSLLIPSTQTPLFADPEEDLPDSFDLIATKAKRVARVTGPTLEGETIPNPNQTHERWDVRATDLGVIWDATTDPEDPKVMIAFGDSYDDGWGGFGGGGDPEGWRANLLAISHDTDLSDGLSFSSMITEEGRDDYAKEILHSDKDTSGNGDFTVIPNAGITVGDRHFIHYFQLRTWDQWTINHAGIAYSDDEGENWSYSDAKWGTDSKFGFASFVKEGGYVYMFGAPTGRLKASYLARVKEENMLVKEKYEYWDGSDWVVNDESAAAPIIDAPVSELSVTYNSYYDKWIMVYLNEDRYSMVMRSSSNLTDGWSGETVIATGEEYPQLYGAMIHPWTNDGQDLYFVMSEWGPYNVVLMHSTLDIGNPAENLLEDPSFEEQETSEISGPWNLENGAGGVDLEKGNGRSGLNNIYLRNDNDWNSISQTVEVEPNTEYLLQGWVRTSQNNRDGYFGVRDENGGILEETQFGHHANYAKKIIRFNSGGSDEVTVFTGMHAHEDTWIQADAYMLLEVDTNAPEITLKGDSVIELPLGSTFTDPGATAFDELDGDLTDKIKVTGEVDTGLIDSYTLTYDVIDADGNEAESVTRTVVITGEDYDVSNPVFKDGEGNELDKLPKDGLVTASVDVRNNTAEENTITIVSVLYDKKGELENVSGVTTAMSAGENETFTSGFKMPGNNSGYTLKVFVADSLTQLNPISNIAEISQK